MWRVAGAFIYIYRRRESCLGPGIREDCKFRTWGKVFGVRQKRGARGGLIRKTGRHRRPKPKRKKKKKGVGSKSLPAGGHARARG